MKTIGIFLAGQAGDLMTATSALHYRNQLWGDCKIIWYAARENFDLLKYQDIEVREFPRGFGYREMVVEENAKLILEGKEPIWENWAPLVDENNHLRIDLLDNYPSLKGIDLGYFPAPHQMTVQQRHGIDYPNCSKKVFDVPESWDWHPVLNWSDEERNAANEFLSGNGGTKKIFIETFAGSSQSILDEEMVNTAIEMCNRHWGDCLFIFGSHKFLRSNEQFPDRLLARADTTSCAKFTVRQCALITQQCDLMLSVSSGLTVAASAWGIRQPVTLQFCGSFICSTKSLAHCDFTLVTADEKPFDVAKQEYYSALEKILIQYK